MPLCWADAEQAMLPEGEIRVLERQRGEFERDWAVVREVVEGEGWEKREWRYYWLVLNSRSFHWKPGGVGREGMGRGKGKGMMVLCPFADYINHGPTGTGCLVRQVEGGYEVVAERDYGKPFLVIFFGDLLEFVLLVAFVSEV